MSIFNFNISLDARLPDLKPVMTLPKDLIGPYQHVIDSYGHVNIIQDFMEYVSGLKGIEDLDIYTQKVIFGLADGVLTIDDNGTIVNAPVSTEA